MIRQLMHPMIRPPKLKSSKYEEYIIQDFERHRVFVDIDVFMKNVLHVPDDWKELWRQTIRDIKCDKTFSISYLDYCHECGIPGAEETRFYEPLVGMANAILDFSDEDSSDSSVKPRTPQRYLRNDPKRILYGVINDLSPDIVAVHKEFLADDGLGEPSGSNLTWAQPLQALEVKPWGGALVDGSCMPRLKVNGERATNSRDHFLTVGTQDKTRRRSTPTLPHRRGSQRRRRPLRPLAWLQTTEQSQLRLFFLPESGLQMSCSTATRRRGSCTMSRPRLVAAPRGRNPGGLGRVKRTVRRLRISRSGGISWTSSPSLPSARTRPSPSWIAIASSSTTQTTRSFSCPQQSASRKMTPMRDWTSLSRL